MTFTDRFLAVLFSGLFLPVISIFHTPAIEWSALFYLSLASLTLIDLFLNFKCPPPLVRRITPRSLWFGEETLVTIEAENRGLMTIYAEIKDCPPPALASYRPSQKVKLGPRMTVSTSYRITPFERGTFTFDSIHAKWTSVIGLLANQMTFPVREMIKVYPSRGKEKSQAVPGWKKSWYTNIGVYAGLSGGEGREFDCLRDYVPGNDVRLMDWKASARRGKPTVRAYKIEKNQRIAILLDCGRTMISRAGDARKLDHAVNSAFSLAEAAVTEGDEVLLMWFSNSVKGIVEAGKGPAQLGRIRESLVRVEPDYFASDYPYAMTELGRWIKRRSLIVLFTDVLDPDSSKDLIESLLRCIPRHLPVCVVLKDSDLEKSACARMVSENDLYTKVASRELLTELEKTLTILESGGVHTICHPAGELGPQTIRHYLDVKYRGFL